MTMPKVRLDGLTGEALELAKLIQGRGQKLRTSRPKNGDAAYVWRMVAFQVSDKPEHHCLPMMADFYISTKHVQGSGTARYEFRKTRAKELDKVVDAIVDLIPKHEWRGIHRWIGLIG